MNEREQSLFDRLSSSFSHLPRRRVLESTDRGELDALLGELDVLFVLGAPGESLAADAARFADRAYVTRVRLVASEVFALTGGSPPPEVIEPAEVREVLALEPRSEAARAMVLPDDLASDVFTAREYAALLARALERGYRFLSFEQALALDPADDGRFILLRHDIDLSPTLALRMAEVEARAGVVSTWFFMLSGAFYDLLEPEHRKVVRRVLELGHTVGFHYDEWDDIAEGLDILSVVAGKRLHHIAQHNPTLLPPRALERADVVDAYDKRIPNVQAFVYVSDSGMRWRHKTLSDLIEEGCPRIYALCHPESWLTEGRDLVSVVRAVEAREHESRRRRFDAFVAGNIGYLRTRREREGR